MELIVETHNLTQRFGTHVALNQVNLSIPKGAVYGFIGPNGAGKTTTMRILTTLLQPTAGEALVNGISVRQNPDAVRKLIGFMPDYFGVYDSMRVWEYLDFFAHVYGIKQPRRTSLIQELLQLVDLTEKHDSYVMNLSRGMKQRLSLARTMAHDPSLLILDEPASGLDPRARIELRELLRELSRMGKTIMVSSHILSELAEMCSHIGIIERGTLLASGPVNEIMQDLRPHKLIEIQVVERAMAALQLLKQIPAINDVNLINELADDQVGGKLAINFSGTSDESSSILSNLIGQGFRVNHFAERQSDLEEVFLHVTQGVVA
ncbi:ABC transporter ATP-binding protein [Herpetosiphon giganteus]|uniref:ABC transporter ATP-binding protein n=1 Tax=Herpetosiphon giganteus TaxID=2029754 RepID=UPI00195E0486|nr:ABC transporter ATP-binding protein [Herpetosiphon giganteus]MBM7846221.1 ABC-2 type transport system ATP-binding protein [Herpetosiphon giganteus]